MLVASPATWKSILDEASAEELLYLRPWLDNIEAVIPELVDRYWTECQKMFASVDDAFNKIYKEELIQHSEREERCGCMQEKLFALIGEQ